MPAEMDRILETLSAYCLCIKGQTSAQAAVAKPLPIICQSAQLKEAPVPVGDDSGVASHPEKAFHDVFAPKEEESPPDQRTTRIVTKVIKMLEGVPPRISKPSLHTERTSKTVFRPKEVVPGGYPTSPVKSSAQLPSDFRPPVIKRTLAATPDAKMQRLQCINRQLRVDHDALRATLTLLCKDWKQSDDRYQKKYDDMLRVLSDRNEEHARAIEQHEAERHFWLGLERLRHEKVTQFYQGTLPKDDIVFEMASKTLSDP